ncbi:MAG: amino acid--tRNA ligase-related protein [Planctomycetota bacterium]
MGFYHGEVTDTYAVRRIPKFADVELDVSIAHVAEEVPGKYGYGRLVPRSIRAEEQLYIVHQPELAFADLNDNADLAEDFLKYIFRALLEERADDMAFFQQRIDKTCIERLETFINADFERMDYTDAISTLEKAASSGTKFEFPVSWGTDLQSEHERYLTEEHVGRPIVIQNYPKDIKAFYMRMNDDEKTVAAMDVLAPGIGEIIGGSQREERLDVLDRRIDEVGLPKEAYWWYRDLRKYGTVPHAGFGLGFERAIIYATGMANIRDVIPFPRTPRNAEF